LIVAEGTSAERQIATYQDAIEGGASTEEALKRVVDHLIEDTVPKV
jgi:carboxylate-amine ligase